MLLTLISTDLVFRLRLPLPDEPPMTLSTLPEFYLEDIADFILFVIQCVLLFILYCCCCGVFLKVVLLSAGTCRKC